MGKILTHMTMSLDGFIADPKDGIGELFEWYEAGDVAVANPNEDVSFRVDAASATMLRDLTENAGALDIHVMSAMPSSRHSPSVWWTRSASASYRCCSVRGSRTSRSSTTVTRSSTTRWSYRDVVQYT